MTSSDGWSRLEKPRKNDPLGRDALAVPPFARLSRTHAFGVGGDALIALALAGSLFFSVDPNSARSRVAIYLVITMVPFVLIAPLVGPAIDRLSGGRRLMIFATMAMRAVLVILMARHLDNLLLYPEAFTVLMLGKAYHVAKSALVPTMLTPRTRLVDLNSKLALLGGVSGALALAPGGLLAWLGGPKWVFGLSALMFLTAAVFSLQIPKTQIAAKPPDALEIAELRSIGVRTAAVAMALMRAIVGFVLFLLAFHLRDIDAHTAWFGALVAASTVGSLTGAIMIPKARDRIREEIIIASMLGYVSMIALLVFFTGGNRMAALLSFSVGLSASACKLSFDSIVQRDAPDANQGRSFARFETRFQLSWVAGAIVPVVLPFRVLTVQAGYLFIALLAGFASLSYGLGLRDMKRGQRPVPAADRFKVRQGYQSVNRAASRAKQRRAQRKKKDERRTRDPSPEEHS